MFCHIFFITEPCQWQQNRLCASAGNEPDDSGRNTHGYLGTTTKEVEEKWKEAEKERSRRSRKEAESSKL